MASTTSQLTRISHSLSLPQSVSTLATSILATLSDPSYDIYYPYASVYLALIASDQPAPSISSLLSLCQSTSLYAISFFQATIKLAANAHDRLPDQINVTHITFISAEHHAFSESAELWRKLSELLKRHSTLFHTVPMMQRMIWIVYLLIVSKSQIARDKSFPLLLSCIVELGLVRNLKPYKLICEIASANIDQLQQYKQVIRNSLPSNLLTTLAPNPSPIFAPNFTTFVKQLDAEYEKSKSDATLKELDRIFIDEPHLLQPPLPPMPPTPSSSPTRRSEGLTTPRGTPMRKRPYPSSTEAPTPRTPATWRRSCLPVTPKKLPSRFSGYNANGDIGKRDALDTLAELACTTPRTPLRSAQNKSTYFPGTPVVGYADVSWLHSLADRRPETRGPPHFSPSSASLETTEALKAAVADKSLWVEIVERSLSLSGELQAVIPDATRSSQLREALAVYFAAIEGCLVHEASRLGQKNGQVKLSLPRNASFHKAILTCAWETTTAAYGRRDSFVFMKAMEVFDVSALEMTKVIESFAKRISGLPKSLATHIITCEHRLLEFTAWEKDSELVTALVERVRKHRSHTSEGNTDDEAASSTGYGKGHAVTEFALELFFRKLMYIASDRITELLTLLGVDSEEDVTKVWETVKVAAFERWPVMVDRHLDQVLLCSVYAVCKVLRYSLRFKDIMSAYRNMTHVKQPSFSHLVGIVSHDVSLDAHHELIARSNDQCSPSRGNGKETRGDVIKFYNQVYIHAMKSHLVGYQPPRVVQDTKEKQSPGNEEPSASCTHPNRSDRLHDTIMKSPLHKRTATSPRRIGRVTVQLTGKSLMSLRQSPGRSVMSPSTRTLYSFGESPVKNLDRINRSVAQPPSSNAAEGTRSPGEGAKRAELRINGTPFGGASAEDRS